MRRLVRVAGIVAIVCLASAHIGSPDAWYSGNAGGYPVLVQVEAPTVVPGIAKVSVLVEGDGVSRVTARVNKFDATAAAPPPDVAERDPNNPSLFTTRLWVMSGGSNAVTVAVEGAKGSGRAIIPVVIVQTHVLKMDKGMGALLAGVGLFLLVGALTIVGAAVREGVLPPGENPDAVRMKRAKRVVAIAAVALIAVLAGGWQWWNGEEAAYRRSIFKPFTASAIVDAPAATPSLVMKISDSVWIMRRDSLWLSKNGRSAFTPMIPDHGKLMHLFVIGGPNNSAFAHLHPVTADSVEFRAVIPPLPQGTYRAFGDVVHESGFSQTLVASFEMPKTAEGRASPSVDPDDSWHLRGPTPGAGRVRLDDGSSLTWEGAGKQITAGSEASLRFTLRDSADRPAELQPYLGMAGHAVVMREDGKVFIHLHPSGTISMASQTVFAMRKPGDSVAGTLSKRLGNDETMDHGEGTMLGSTVAFPYAFPNAGKYHVWVQVKRSGRIMTAVYEARVSEPVPRS